MTLGGNTAGKRKIKGWYQRTFAAEACVSSLKVSGIGAEIRKKAAPIILTALLFCSGMMVTVNAAVVAQGTCGHYGMYRHTVWSLDDKGILTIAPEDPAEEGPGYVESSPWDSSLVKEIVVKAGITRINKRVFEIHKNLKKVTLPEGFSTIGGGAFYSCQNLTEVVVQGNNVLNEVGWFLEDDITAGAFENCTSLRSIPVLSDTVMERTFFGCTNLNHVVIAEGVTSIGVSAFAQCSSLSDLTLPSTLKSIDDQAFSECGLESVVLPNGVTDIPFYAFSGSRNLKTIVIPDSVTIIETGAFQGCALTEVKLSKNVSRIGGSDYGTTNDFAFEKNVVIDAPAGSYAAQWAKANGFTLKGEKKTADDGKSSDTKSDKKTEKVVRTAAGSFVISAGQAAFTAPADKKVSSLVIPSKVKGVKVTSIAPNACAKMKKLKKVTIPSGVKKIGKKAFYGCTKLKEITIKTRQLKTVGANAFGSINKKAVIKCPKSKKASYKKLLLKKGLKKTVTFKS